MGRLLDNIFTDVYEVAKDKYRRLDENKIFTVIYEEALKSYKKEVGEDDLYDKFFKDGTDRMNYIEESLNHPNLSRETGIELIEYIQNECGTGEVEIQKFLTLLFIGLLESEGYHDKIMSYRQDHESGDTNKMVRQLYDNAFNDKNYRNEVKFENNKKQYYIDKWNDRLFLNTSEEDNLFLYNTFIMPDYKTGYYTDHKKDHMKLHDLENRFRKFCTSKNGTMLILGQPGMGKTSITAYLADKYKDNGNLIILRFRDLEDEDLQVGLIKAIYAELNCKRADLTNKLLILDGFDETKYSGDVNKLLGTFLLDIREIDSLRLIVTSRENYIDFKSVKFITTIVLQPFDKDRINEFCKKICGENTKQKDNKSNIKVLGIPVILYMALVVGIDITTDSSKSELYEMIFSLEGGIFDRFSSYEIGAHPLEYRKRDYHYILQLLAFKMFDEKKDNIAKKDYIPIVNKVVSGQAEQVIFDFPIKNLYEMGVGIEFVHRSIYEYFTAEYIYQEMKQVFSDRDIEKIASKLGRLLKGYYLSKEIIEFLEHKMNHDIVINDEYACFNAAFNLMISDGMTFHTKEVFKKVVDCESYIFINMLQIMHLWNFETNELICFEDKKLFTRYIGIKNKMDSYSYYQKFENNLTNVYINVGNIHYRFDFRRVDLSKVKLTYTDLNGIDLSSSNLREAKLYKSNLLIANLSGADLSGANLSGANLSGADLRNANIRNANLSGANLSGANLSGADLSGANLRKVDLSGAVFDEKNIQYIETNYPDEVSKVRIELDMGKIVKYAEYKRRQAETKTE